MRPHTWYEAVMATYLKKVNISVQQFVLLHVSHEAVGGLSDKMYGKRDYVSRRNAMRAVRRVGHKLVTPSDCSDERKPAKNPKLVSISFESVFDALDRSDDEWRELLKETYCPANSIYGKFCTLLGESNSKKNRKCMKNKCIDHLKGIQRLSALCEDTVVTSESENEMGPGVVVAEKHKKITYTLPRGSMNEWKEEMRADDDRKPRKLDFKVCEYNEGSVNIPHVVWSDVYVRNDLKAGVYQTFFVKYFARVNNICVPLIRNRRANKNEIVLYVYCKHKLCKTFVCTIQKSTEGSEGVVMSVFSSGLHFVHDPSAPITRPLRGLDRRINEERLLKSTPTVVRSEDVNNSLDALIKVGNSDGITSLAVLKNIRSESLAKKDRDPDHVIDALLMKKSHDARGHQFIQLVSMPFTVEVMSVQQLQVALTALDRDGWLDMHIDATGTVVRQPDGVTKQIYYYCAVIHLGGGLNKPFPVFEQVTCRQDSASISRWLLEFKAFCVLNRKWPIADRVVIDGSQALLKAILNSWGLMETFTYLNMCYSYVIRGQVLRVSPDLPVIVKFCCAHMLKNMTHLLNDKIDKRLEDFKHYLKEAMANLFCIDSIWHASLWFDHLTVVLLTVKSNPQVVNSLSELQNLTLHAPNDTAVAELARVINVSQPVNGATTTLHNSMFYVHFCMIRDRRKELLPNITSGENNEYYDPELLDLLIDRFFKYYPLWAGAKTFPGDVSRERCSNAIVENFIGLVKNNLLNNILRQRVSRFLRVLRNHTVSVSKEFLLNIPKHSCTPRKTSNRVKPLKTVLNESRSTSVSSVGNRTLKKNSGAQQHVLGFDERSLAQCLEILEALEGPMNECDTAQLEILSDLTFQNTSTEQWSGVTLKGDDKVTNSITKPFPVVCGNVERVTHTFADVAQECPVVVVEQLGRSNTNVEEAEVLVVDEVVTSKPVSQSLPKPTPLTDTGGDVEREPAGDPVEEWGRSSRNRKHTYFKKSFTTNHFQRVVLTSFQTLPNCLVSDIGYYSTLIRSNNQNIKRCVIASMLRRGLPYGSFDVETLSCLKVTKRGTDSWLNGDVIDGAVSQLLLGQSKCTAFSCQLASMLIVGGSDFDMSSLPSLEECDNLFLPLNEGNHWIVMHVDLGKGLLELYDPLGVSPSKTERAICKFKTFADKYNSKTLESERKLPQKIDSYNVPRPWQTDAYNCGVFVIKYIESVVKSTEFNQQFVADAYRTDILRLNRRF